MVLRAKNEQTRQLCAVKVQLTERRQAMHEAHVASTVRGCAHPCIVRLFNIFMVGDWVFLEMEICSALTLQHQIDEARRQSRQPKMGYCNEIYVPPLGSLFWIGQIYVGMEYVHNKMVQLLRDLKPDNVGLAPHGRSLRVKLLDFGTHAFGALSYGVWTLGHPQGTPGYVSPELIRQWPYDFKTDLYSLGVLVWVTFTGGYSDGGKAGPRFAMGTCSKRDPLQRYYDDHFVFRADLSHPPANHKRLDAETFRIVDALTETKAAERPGHGAIRDFAVMSGLCIPEASQENGYASVHDVNDWLQGNGPAATTCTFL